MQNCNQCGFKFTLLSQRFYCCNQSQPVCSICHRKVCQKCQKPRTHEIIIPRCDKCCSRLYQSDLLFQYNCEKYYCSKCLSHIFKDAYDKVKVQKMYDEDTQVFVQFSCGHQYPFEQMVGFFQHFCLCCGTSYDSGLDYEFNDGVKLCFVCYRYFGKKYQNILIKCQMCQSIIKNSSKASILQNTDTAICQRCTFESKLQQDKIKKSTIEQQIYIQPQIVKYDSFIHKQAPKKQEKPVQNNNQNFQTNKPKNKLTKLLKKPSILQLKKKQSKRAPTDKSNSISVTSRFTNEFQEIDEETTKSLGLTQNIKLKRHLSNQTYVEQYKTQVPQNMEKDFIKCKRCNVLVLLGQAYNLYEGAQKMNGKKSIVDFSTLKTISSLSEESSYFICRICYSKSSQRQKSRLSLSGVKSKLQTSNRPSKIDQSIPNMDYLKVGKSFMRQNRSPSPSPTDKQYSLTGSRVDIGSKSSLNVTKQSLLSSNQEKKVFTRPLIHPVSTQSRASMSNNAPRFMKCDACRDVKKSLIATLNQGYLCDDCYYSKNPSFSFFNRR